MDLRSEFNKCHAKFEAALEQMGLLDELVGDIQIRYHRAQEKRRTSFAYSLRIRMSVIAGVRMMYHEYAKRASRRMIVLQRQIEEETGGGDMDTSAVYYSDSDESDFSDPQEWSSGS